MIPYLQSYPKYKDSGVEWLGQVPEGWMVSPLCNLAKVKNEIGKEKLELLSVYLNKGVIRFNDVLEKRTNVTSEDLSKYQVVDPGDLVLNNQQAWRGSVGISQFKGIVSPAYLVLTLGSEINSDFANIVFRDRVMVTHYLINSKGVGSIQRNLYWPHLKRVPVFLPTYEEQAAIVRYLNYTNSRIQQYIATKQKLIKLLEEQKQAIIHQAVIGAIDVSTGKPYPKYKDSGVEWLGKVPEGWNINKIKFISKVNPSTRIADITNDEKVEFIPMENVDEKAGVISKYELKLYGEVSQGYTTFKNQDIIFAKITPCMENGNCAIVGDLRTGVAFGSTEFIVFRTKATKTTASFLHLVLRDRYLRSICEIYMKGSAGQKRISPDFLSNYKIAFPSLENQRSIVDFINLQLSIVNKTVDKAEREIELLKEYRARLTADVVTGKVDVREASKYMPAEVTNSIVNDPNNDDIEVNEMLDEITEE